MKRKFLVVGISLTLLGFGMTGCGQANPKQADAQPASTSEKDQAAEVVKQFLDSQAKITYKDPSTYQAGDKYLSSDAAKSYNAQRTAMYKFFTDEQITISGSPDTITLLKQEKDKYVFEGKKTFTLQSDKEKKSLGNITLDDDFTVTKGANGTFLISEIKNHAAK
jgi:hypothetical protein